MPIAEIFERPLVKKVIFQINFPNLFFIENKVGEFQSLIIKQFPKSSLSFRRQFMVADIGENVKSIDVPSDVEANSVRKVWHFESDKNFKLDLLTNSLSITSEYHKTYNLDGGDKFRDCIESVLNEFYKVIPIPIISRIGLRYINFCPLPQKTKTMLSSWYKTTFPINRFDVADAEHMEFQTITKRGAGKLRFHEALVKEGDGYKLLLDYDAFAENIDPANTLATSDTLHDVIMEEFESSVNDPVLEYMRKKP